MKRYVMKEGNYKNQGITVYHKGYQVTVAAKNVETISMVLYDEKTEEVEEELELPIKYRKGNLYS